MTDPLFLTSISLENYRSFGDGTVPLEPGPSVLVVAGTNGLGKTSLIEGVEWALTGRFRRFDEKQQAGAEQAVARRVDGAVTGIPAVTLAFSDGTKMRRKPGPQLTMNTDGESPQAYTDVEAAERRAVGILKHPEWSRPIHDLSAYLGLTHFLSQSPTLRIMSRDPVQRWADLSGLTGTARIDRMMERLARGQKTGQMTKEKNKRVAEHDTLARRRDNLVGLMRQVKELDALLRASVAISPERVLEEVEALAAQLAPHVGETVAQPGDAAQALSTMAEAAQHGIDGLDRRLVLFTQLDALPGKWHDLGDALTRSRGDLEAVEAVLEAAEAAEAAARHRDRLAERARLFDRLAPLEAEVDAADKALVTAVTEVEKAEQALRAVTAEHDAWIDLADKVTQEQAVVEQWRTLAAQEKTVRASVAVARAQESQRLSAEAAVKAAEVRVTAAEEARDAADRQVALAEKEAAAAADAVNDKAHHLQALIHALHDDETECPLCLTRKDDPGWVLARAREAVEREDPALKVANVRLTEAGRQRAVCEEAFADARASLQAARTALAPFDRRRADTAELMQALLDNQRVPGIPFEQLADWLRHRVQAAETALDERLRARDAADPDGTLADRRTRAERALGERRHAVASAGERLGDLGRKRADLKALLAENGKTAGEYDRSGTGSALAKAERTAREAAIAASTEMVERIRADLRGDRDPKVAGPWRDLAATLRWQADEHEEQRLDLREQWRRADLEGAPSRATLSEAERRARQGRFELHAVQARCATLSHGLKAWQDDARMTTLRQAIAEIVRKEGAADAQACLIRLDKRLAAALAEVRRWTRAQELITNVGKAVEAEQEKFTTAIIEPLAARSVAFDEMWSSFPEVQASLQARRLRGKSQLEYAVDGISAEYLYSEGQAGGKALSFLLAASTAYRWSRWRALLLDDPLQYNDLVHKAAFLDLLRPMVRDLGYQVVMSTHDLEEAAFIQRKCRNAGIPFTLCRLRSIERGGVTFDLT